MFGLHDPTNENIMLFQNFGVHLPVDKSWHPKR